MLLGLLHQVVTWSQVLAGLGGGGGGCVGGGGGVGNGCGGGGDGGDGCVVSCWVFT